MVQQCTCSQLQEVEVAVCHCWWWLPGLVEQAFCCVAYSPANLVGSYGRDAVEVDNVTTVMMVSHLKLVIVSAGGCNGIRMIGANSMPYHRCGSSCVPLHIRCTPQAIWVCDS